MKTRTLTSFLLAVGTASAAVGAFNTNGVIFKTPRTGMTVDYQLKKLKKAGINTVAFTPPAIQDDPARPEIKYPLGFDFRMEKQIKLAKRMGFKVVLQPEIGSSEESALNSRWHSMVRMRSEEEWRRWFENYDRMIRHYAAVAQRLRMDAFVVGDGYDKATRNRETEWRRVITNVRAIYTGSVSYAAAGLEEADRITFWDAVDIIAVDAYFPLSYLNTPQQDEVKLSWASYRTSLALLSRRAANKKITLIGIETFDASTYDAMFGAVSGAEWIDGVFIHDADDTLIGDRFKGL